MNCQNCGSELKEGAKFCKQCGAAQEMVEVEQEQEKGEGSFLNMDLHVSIEPNEEDEVTQEEPKAAFKGLKELWKKIAIKKIDIKKIDIKKIDIKKIDIKNIDIKKKKKLCYLLGLCIVIIVVCMVQRLDGNKTTQILVYQTSDQELYKQVGKTEFEEVIDDLKMYRYDDALQHFYLLDDGDNLYYQYKNKDKERLAKDVATFAISEDGKKAVYIEDYDYNDGEGTLIYQAKGKDAKTITKACSDQALISKNGKYVLYGERDNDLLMTAYISRDGEKGEELSDEVQELIDVLDNGDVLFCNEDYDLIRINARGKEETLIKEVQAVQVTEDGKKIYAITMDEEIGVYKNNKWEELQGKDVEPYSLMKITPEKGKEYFMFKDDKGAKLILPNEHLIEIKDYDGGSIAFMEDAKTVYYIDEDGDLCVVTVGRKDVKYEERIAKDVEKLVRMQGDASIYYIDEDGDAYSYKYKKKSEAMAKDVVSLATDKKEQIYYVDDEGVLNYLSKNGKSQEVLEDIRYCTRGADGRIYAVDQDEDLYVVIKGTKTEKIGKDVAYLYRIGKSGLPEVNTRDYDRWLGLYY